LAHGSEEPVQLLDVHRPAALAAFEEVAEAVEFGVGQGLVRLVDSDRHLGKTSVVVPDEA
jgi:predicted oxidoreductase